MVWKGHVGGWEGFQPQLVLQAHVGGDESGSQLGELGHLRRVVGPGGVTVVVGPPRLMDGSVGC